MYKTFTGGQKQTEISLSIAQYNIYHSELQGLIKEAKDIKFTSTLQQPLNPPNPHFNINNYNSLFNTSNGINYIQIFSIVTNLLYQTAERQDLIIDFRHNVLFPLSRYYKRLSHFLNRIKSDKVLSQDYKNILYTSIEREILPIYFSVCNSIWGDRKSVDLSVFKTKVYDPNTFYEINTFYIENNLFNFFDFEFYQRQPI